MKRKFKVSCFTCQGNKGTEMLLPSVTGQRLMAMFDILLDHFGHQHWWPGDSAFEMMAGAILTQNTSWKNVEKAIETLKFENLLSVKAMQIISVQDLAERIRPAGYFNIKANRLKNLINFIWQKHKGDLAHLLNQDSHLLREQLLSVKGIGPETADSILLYAARRPVFVIDTYTYRILNRHEMVGNEVSYDELQELFMHHLPEDAVLFNEFHALIVKTGKEYCRKKPRCNECPLEKW